MHSTMQRSLMRCCLSAYETPARLNLHVLFCRPDKGSHAASGKKLRKSGEITALLCNCTISWQI